ncbi:uncharacterized mitochondrial protein-like protein [Tanacetum coccineum]
MSFKLPSSLLCEFSIEGAGECEGEGSGEGEGEDSGEGEGKDVILEGEVEEEGMDYDEVFAPVARIKAIRMFLAYASYMGFMVCQIDVKSAFLYGQIEEEVYKKKGIFISQDKYVHEILRKYNYTDVKSASTLTDLEKPLVQDGDAADVDEHLYRSMIGSLMYLTASRPDINVAIRACDIGILRFSMGISSYTDSDYARATQDRKSTTGGCQFLGNRLISWQCKKQTVVATSTTKAEYVAATSCCGQVLWIQNQLLDYRYHQEELYIHKEEMAPMALSDSKYDDLLVKLDDTGFKAATYKTGLVTLEEQIIKYREHEVLFSEEIALLKRSVGNKEYHLGLLRTELEKVKEEKEGFEFKIAKFEKSANDLDQLLASQITDKSKKGVGYNDVPSPHPLILNRPTPLDLSYSGLEEFKQPETDSSSVKSSLKVDKDWKENFFCPANQVREEEPKKARENNDALIIEDWVSDDEDDVEPIPKVEKKTVIPTATKKEFVKPKKPVRRLVRARGFNAVKPSACWVWKPIRTNGSSLSNSQLNDKGFVDSGCSRHMSGNIAHLSYFKDFDGGNTEPLVRPRFSWVFFLRTKDESSEILKNFIKEIENLVDKKVKIIRSDNGTEFKNKVMDDFCREKVSIRRILGYGYSVLTSCIVLGPREGNIDEYWWRIYKSGNFEVLES